MKGTAVLTLFCVLVAACNQDTPNDAAAATAGRGGAARGSGAASATGQSGQSGAPAPGGRGRGSTSITLAPTDVTVIQPATIEDVTPISGDLRPIETVDVRSRLE